MPKIRNNSSAFTLAEVLITLGIIGIVAAITIPNLIANYQKQTYVTSFKKFYSTYQQGIASMLQKAGCEDLECLGWWTESTVTPPAGWLEQRDKAFRENFNIVETYNNINPNPYQRKLKRLSGAALGYDDFITNDDNRYLIILADGTLIWQRSTQCYPSPSVNISKYAKRCSWTLVDINGNKNPNQYGRDVFSLYLTYDGKLIPDYGVDYAQIESGEDWETSSNYWKNSNGCSKTAGFGDGCAAKLIEEGWQMNY